MHLTLMGAILLPLCVLWFPRPERLLALVFFCGIFHAATPVVIGSLGLPPAVPPASMFVLYVAVQIALGAPFEGARSVLRTLEPQIAAVGYGLISAVTMPRLFSRALQVWPQKEGIIAGTVALMPGPGNMTQGLYLLITGVMLAAAALFLARREADLRRLLDAYLWSGVAAIAFAFWQMASKLGGVWFPTDFLYTNPGFALLHAQQISFVPRISGSFAEPADLAYYLSGLIFASGWMVLCGTPARLPRVTLIGGVLAMLISTSTTGLVVLAAGAGACVPIALLRAGSVVGRRIVRIGLPLVLALVLAGGVAVTLKPSIGRSLALVYSSTLDKQQSTSFEDRTTKDLDALATAGPTWGMGVGWGSSRSSSLLPGLVANLGIWGTALLVWFGARLLLLVRRARHTPALEGGGDVGDRWAIEGCFAACLGTLVAALISSPAVINLDFYLLLAILVAASVRVSVLDRLVLRQEAGALPA